MHASPLILATIQMRWMVTPLAIIFCSAEDPTKKGHLRANTKNGTSLFQAYALSPYPNYYYPQGYYPPPPGYMVQYDPYMVPQQPYYPQQPQYIPPPPQPQYIPPPPQPPQYMPQQPPPQQQVYYVVPPQREQVQRQPAPAVSVPVPVVPQAIPRQAPVPAVTPTSVSLKVDLPPKESPNTPMKEALQKELDDAARALDRIGSHAPDLSQFDNLAWTKPSAPQPMSLSQDPVPLDSHILNWRELVGLPDNKSSST